MLSNFIAGLPKAESARPPRRLGVAADRLGAGRAAPGHGALRPRAAA
ncbi:hypothetical protein [Nocardioides convexus]|nr:hypothetical protein [Nocardioides convexus]